MGSFLCRLFCVALLIGALVNFTTVFAFSPAFNTEERLENLTGGWRVANMAAHYDKAEYLRELAGTYLNEADLPDDPRAEDATDISMEELATRTRNALDLINQSLRLDPASASGWAHLAQAQGRFYDFDTMRASLKRSWELAPNSAQLAPLRLQLAAQIYRASFDPPVAEMGLRFGDGTLAPGTYAVRLLMGNSFGGTSSPGARAFDVLIEDQLFLDDLDLITSFGHNAGGVFEWVGEVRDGTIDIDFARVINDPLINGVEVIQRDVAPVDPIPEASDPGVDETVEEAPVGPNILYRWNAGTSNVPARDEGPDWIADASVVVGGPIIQIYSRRIANLDPSASQYMIPIDLYSQERWPPSAGRVAPLSQQELASVRRDIQILDAHAPEALERILANADDPIRALITALGPLPHDSSS